MITISSRKDMSSNELNAMHKLRARIFRERKGWDVSIIGGMEIDGYDALEPLYMLMHKEDKITGCWRILPTTGPYMLEHTFSKLLHGEKPPKSDRIWELSRFAVDAAHKSAHGLSVDSVRAIKAVTEFAITQGVQQFVTVTTVGVEKLLKRKGLAVSRFGSSIQIGIERAVALRIDLNDKTADALRWTQDSYAHGFAPVTAEPESDRQYTRRDWKPPLTQELEVS